MIRPYIQSDEKGWLRCRVISFLDTAYFDNVLTAKETYQNPALELIAELDGNIVGLIDVEYEKEIGAAAYNCDKLGAVIWHIAVLPENQKRGIASSLLKAALEELSKHGIKKVQAWTRDDKWVNDWYLKQGFKWKESYLHVYTEGDECDEVSESKMKKLYICNSFCHYMGDDKEEIKRKFKRVHECNLYELDL